MRIVMILSEPLPPREGIGFYAWNLAKYLVSKGHQIHLITRGGIHPMVREEMEGITIWKPTFLPIYPFHVHLHSMFVNPLIRRLDPQVDLYHLHSPLVSAIKTGKPVLVTVHTPVRADARATPMNSWLGLLVKLQMPTSVILEYKLFKKADQLVSVSWSVASELSEYGIDPRRVVVAGNGADIEIFHPAVIQQDGNKTYFFTACRLSLRKGLKDLIHCAQIVVHYYPEVQFWVAGDGPLKFELEKLIQQVNLVENFRLLGHISSHRHLAELYQGATGFIHPAHYEGLPTVLLEAMACSCPVVATEVSGALDVVRDGENGLLTPPRNPQMLAEAVMRLIREPALRRHIGRAARQTIEAYYSWEVVGQRYLQEYQQLVNSKKPR